VKAPRAQRVGRHTGPRGRPLTRDWRQWAPLLALCVMLGMTRSDARADDKAVGPELPVQAAKHLGTERYALVIGINNYADARIPDLKF